MDYTQSNAYATHSSGRRMHQQTAPVTTAVSSDDMNMVIWSLLRLIEAAGVTKSAFNPDDPSSFDKVRQAIVALVNSAATAAAVGFTPVEQGGGSGQTTNKIRIGWSSAGRLKAQVDSTDLGNFAFDTQLANYVPKSGGAMSGGLAWGNTGVGPGTGDGASYGTYNLAISSWNGIGFVDVMDGQCRVVVNTRTGSVSTQGILSAIGGVIAGANASASPVFAFTDDAASGITHSGPGDIGLKGRGIQLLDNNGDELNARVSFRAPMLHANTGVNPATFNKQGAYLAWNTSNGGGQADIVCNRGGGSGGFVFRVLNQDGSVASVPASIGADGMMGLSSSPAGMDTSELVATTRHVKDYLANYALTGSIGLPGSQKLAPNGLQIRYGVAPSSLVGGGGVNPVDFSFATAFPNACLLLFPTLNGNASGRSVEWNPGATSNVGARITYASQNSTTVTMQASYLAIGY